jgi:hypothetical protein
MAAVDRQWYEDGPATGRQHDKLDNRRHNQLLGCMHAHNSYLNRLLLFVQNAAADGEPHDRAQFVQMWSTLQILAGKTCETRTMLAERRQ